MGCRHLLDDAAVVAFARDGFHIVTPTATSDTNLLQQICAQADEMQAGKTEILP